MPQPLEGSYQEEALLKRLASSDERAFNTIYQRYNQMIFTASMIYLKDIDVARDIVQQVFLRLWEKRAMAVNIDNFQGYIIVTSRNLIYDQFRKANAETRKIAELANREACSFVETGASHAEEREYVRVIAAAIAGLPPQQKKIFLMIQEQQMSYKEVAAAVRLSPFTVKKHLELARRSVREYVTRKISF